MSTENEKAIIRINFIQFIETNLVVHWSSNFKIKVVKQGHSKKTIWCKYKEKRAIHRNTLFLGRLIMKCIVGTK